MSQDTGNVTVRMPIKKQKKLDQIASEIDRSRNWLINEAVEQYLDVYDWQEKRIRERLKKAEMGGRFYTKAQVNEVIESVKLLSGKKVVAQRNAAIGKKTKIFEKKVQRLLQSSV